MGDRYAVRGNPAPGSDPVPGVPAANFSTGNPMSTGGGSWAPFAPDLEENGELAIRGNMAAGSEPENGPTMSQSQPMCDAGGWGEERFAVPGNPAPGSDPCPY